jgi:rhodanese-related sulfurtransferase
MLNGHPMKPRSLDRLLAEARGRLDRVPPERLDAEVENGALVVDIRDSALRATQGDLPGAVVIDLTVLEWRLAPSSAHRSFDIVPGQKVILVCSEGYSSSLAAARLQDLGVDGATDLEGGFTAWNAQHSHPGTPFGDVSDPSR